MLEAGITLLRSLDVILSQIESRTLHKVLTQVRNDVEQGRSLSSSLEKHPKHFSQFWVSLVEVGEASGTMPQVLEKLAIFMGKPGGVQIHHHLSDYLSLYPVDGLFGRDRLFCILRRAKI